MFSRKDLLNITLTAAQTAQVYGPFALPPTCGGLTLEGQMVYGSSGTTAKAWVQTSLDGGDTWLDIACFAFTTATKQRVCNLRANTVVTTLATPVDGSLADDTAVDGLLGDRIRVKLTSTGTYAGSTTVRVTAQPKL